MNWEEMRYKMMINIINGYHNAGCDRAHERLMACAILTESLTQEDAQAKLEDKFTKTGDEFYQYQANKLAPK